MKRILGIDYGTKRIGIAVSDPLMIIATGLKVISNDNNALQIIKELADRYEVSDIVVGLPLNLKGEIGGKALEVEKFISDLQQATEKNIIKWDERYTSSIAQQTLIRMGVRKKARQNKSKIDEMAAALILQSYLETNKKY